MTTAALEAQDVSVAYRRTGGSIATVVSMAGLHLAAGEIVGLTGESGCGKSSLARACIGAVSDGGRITSGRVLVGDVDLLAVPAAVRRGYWGRHVAYVPQNPAAALHPAMRIGRQLSQPIATHLGLRGPQLRERAEQLLERLGIADPPLALRRYPHELSGGQQQRIALAIAIACDPGVLILDEPTTGLDVTTQTNVVELLKGIVADTGAAALHVSHDLALLSGVADRLLVMYAGEIVETGPAAAVVRDPRHPYTRALLAAVPSGRERRILCGLPGRPPPAVVDDACAFAARCESARQACAGAHPTLEPLGGERAVRCIRHRELGILSPPDGRRVAPFAPPGVTLLEIDDLSCQYRGQQTPALDGIVLTLARGDTLAVVGESGSGKTTLLRAIAGLHPPRSGTLRLEGRELAPHARSRPRDVRRDIQLVFQDPDSSLNPRQSIGEILSRPIHLFRNDVTRRTIGDAVAAALEEVKLPADAARHYPDELSGGERQRIAIARAFAARPSLLLCDEVTSALDVSVQATILELIAELTATHATTIVFVTHDLAVARTICRQAVVLKAGEICEQGTTDDVFSAPKHPYVRELIAAIPSVTRAPVRVAPLVPGRAGSA